jgi:hypothetical protein
VANKKPENSTVTPAQLTPSDRGWDISAAGNNDNRHLGALLRDYLLQFKSVQVWEREIEDEASGREAAVE